MCNIACILFGAKSLAREEVAGKRVLEVGSYDVNGTLRPLLDSWGPAEYVGADILAGPGVDVICRAERLVERFGENSFDLVLATEVMEHVFPWREVISNLKRVCRPGGVILVTTRSPGYPYHAYPADFWRYTQDDIRKIFSDCELLALADDESHPGVFVKVRKPAAFQEIDLSGLALESVLTGKRQMTVTARDYWTWRYVSGAAKDRLKSLVFALGKKAMRGG